MIALPPTPSVRRPGAGGAARLRQRGAVLAALLPRRGAGAAALARLLAPQVGLDEPVAPHRVVAEALTEALTEALQRPRAESVWSARP